MSFADRSAEGVLVEGALPEYKQGMEFFYRELVGLNVDLYIVEKILQFPFSLFTPPEKMTFFSRVVDNFIGMGILTITKIATDNGTDLYTMHGFRNRLLRLVQAQFHDDFRNLLRESRFDDATRELLERARKLRDGRIAHAIQALAFGILPEARVEFQELQSLRDVMNRQLDVLSFNVEHLMLPIEYDPRVQHSPGTAHSTDIEEALDAVARNSVLLNLPEQRPQVWQRRRPSLTEIELDQLNQYRRKFGLPCV